MTNLKNLPLGIKIIALFNTLGALVLLIHSFAMRTYIASRFSKMDTIFFAALVTLTYLIAVGLWLARDWARYVYIFHLTLNIISLHLQGVLIREPRMFIGVLFEIVVIAYLFLWPKAREAFK